MYAELSICARFLEEKFINLSTLSIGTGPSTDYFVLLQSFAAMKMLRTLRLIDGHLSGKSCELFRHLTALVDLSLTCVRVGSYWLLGKALACGSIEMFECIHGNIYPNDLKVLLDEVRIDHVHVVPVFDDDGDYLSLNFADLSLKSCFIAKR